MPEPQRTDASLPVGITAGRLRAVADTLDAMQKLTGVLYRPLATAEGPPDGVLELKIRLRRNGRPADAEYAQSILDAVDGSEMQESLRWWADVLEAGHPLPIEAAESAPSAPEGEA
jgi:hypothetical protein